MLLGILAVNLDLPLCVFLLDASETNYSGFRGAIDICSIAIMSNHIHLVVRNRPDIAVQWSDDYGIRRINPATTADSAARPRQLQGGR